jgi:hypothetical protein
MERLREEIRLLLEDNRSLRKETGRLETSLIVSQERGTRWKHIALYVFLTPAYHFLN